MNDEKLDALFETSNKILLEIISEEVDTDMAITNALNTVTEELKTDGM